MKRLIHFLLGHEWFEIDIFQFGERNYAAVNESNFRYYRCFCGKEIREKPQKIVQMIRAGQDPSSFFQELLTKK